LVDAQHLPQGQCQAGDRHLKFHDIQDNLQVRAALGLLAGRLVGDDRSHVSRRRGESQSTLSWVGNRVRNAKPIAESISENNPMAPGSTLARWARSWLAIATRATTRS